MRGLALRLAAAITARERARHRGRLLERAAAARTAKGLPISPRLAQARTRARARFERAAARIVALRRRPARRRARDTARAAERADAEVRADAHRRPLPAPSGPYAPIRLAINAHVHACGQCQRVEQCTTVDCRRGLFSRCATCGGVAA